MNIDVVLGLLAGLIVGLGLALVIVKIRGGNDAEEVKKLKEEHEKYRQEVDSHFVKTAGLFKGLTDQYRDVYKHMAEGANELCSDEVKTLQSDLAATGLLTQAEDVVVDKENSEASSTAEPEKVAEPEVKEANEDAAPDIQPAKDHVEVSVEKQAEKQAEKQTDESPEKVVEESIEKKEVSNEEDDFPLASEAEIPSELAEEKKK